MSEYLGWTEKSTRQSRDLDPTRFDRNVIPGGVVTQGFENYVKSLFRPNQNPEMPAKLTNNSTVTAMQTSNGLAPGKKISASAMLKMANELGDGALDDTMDEDALENPLDSIYAELGISGLDVTSVNPIRLSQYQVYTPKTSTEYYSTKASTTSSGYLPSGYRSSFRTNPTPVSYRERFDEEWKKNNRQTLVDYKDFGSSPLSPYMYQAHQYTRPQDSRIVGSNFVQLTTRPKDRFLEKIDQTLAEVRSSPRYTY
ncbi:hypothetical protein Ddc_00499 [Ditylenchus destructor]|nr:hypothetical protein Ddc_00499 [Ditylenchus destructor]